MTPKTVTYLTRRMPESLRERMRLEAHRRKRLREPRGTMEDVLNDALSIGLYALEQRRSVHRAHWAVVSDEPARSVPSETPPR